MSTWPKTSGAWKRQEEIVVGYRDGLSRELLGAAFGCSDDTIKTILRANGVTPRDSSGRVPFTPEEKTSMAQMYIEETLSIQIISGRTGYGQDRIRHMLRAEGVIMRSQHEALDAFSSRKTRRVKCKSCHIRLTNEERIGTTSPDGKLCADCYTFKLTGHWPTWREHESIACGSSQRDFSGDGSGQEALGCVA